MCPEMFPTHSVHLFFTSPLTSFVLSVPFRKWPIGIFRAIQTSLQIFLKLILLIRLCFLSCFKYHKAIESILYKFLTKNGFLLIRYKTKYYLSEIGMLSETATNNSYFTDNLRIKSFLLRTKSLCL